MSEIAKTVVGFLMLVFAATLWLVDFVTGRRIAAFRQRIRPRVQRVLEWVRSDNV